MTWGRRFPIRRKGAKYGNKPTELAGRTFDSKGESRCFLYLKAREQAGEIADIQAQHTVTLLPGLGGWRPIQYRADFRYRDLKTGATVWVDYKGHEDAIWMLKKKLWAFFGPGKLLVIKGAGMKVVEEIEPEPITEVLEGIAAAVEAQTRFQEKGNA